VSTKEVEGRKASSICCSTVLDIAEAIPIRHVYERIDLSTIRNAVIEDLPPLKAAVLSVLSPPEDRS